MTSECSKFSKLIGNSFRQSCVIYKLMNYDVNGQPVYGDAREAKCRIEFNSSLLPKERGDIMTNRSVRIFLPGDDDIEAGDRIDLPSPWNANVSIITGVKVCVHIDGKISHKEAAVL